MMRLIFSTLLFSWLCLCDPNKRVVEDSPRTPSILGGGDLNRAKRSRITPDETTSTLLLQVSSEDLPESYTFLLDDKYASCYSNDDEGQGQSCNSCWAFAVQKMMQARLCRQKFNKDSAAVFYALSPLNMICHMQSTKEGESICDPKNIYEALEYATHPGILLESWVANWKYHDPRFIMILICAYKFMDNFNLHFIFM
jgi:hypothetical protein